MTARTGLVLACAMATCGAGALPAWAQDRAGVHQADEEHAVSDEEFRLALTDEESAEVDRLIGDLGSPEYGKREAAAARLIEIGAPAFDRLRTTYGNADDLETRLRIEEIVRQGYLNYHVYSRNGFLGIRQDPRQVVHADDPRIAEGNLGIRIAGILPGTAAEGVDLQEQDIIIALDGEPVTANANDPMLAFGESLRLRGPATPVTLLVLRGNRTAEVRVALRPRPKEYYAGDNPVTHMLLQAEAGFDAWWMLHFRKQASGP